MHDPREVLDSESNSSESEGEARWHAEQIRKGVRVAERSRAGAHKAASASDDVVCLQGSP